MMFYYCEQCGRKFVWRRRYLRHVLGNECESDW